MATTKLTAKQRKARNKARLDIIQAVNRHAVRFHAYHPYAPALLGSRHIQRAVRIARHHGLVKPAVLTAAGFRETGR